MKISFVLGSTKYGPMILSHLDYNPCGGEKYGIGYSMLKYGYYDEEEVQFLMDLINLKRQINGDDVIIIDCGANIGTHTIPFGKMTTGWGKVYAIEAQEKLFYALAGNIVLNNLFNIKAINAAVSNEDGLMTIPEPDYAKAASFGSFELIKNEQTENIGQFVDYSKTTLEIPKIRLDQLKLKRCDFIKMDVEGMEVMALKGALETIERCKPLMCIEFIKSNVIDIEKILKPLGYKFAGLDIKPRNNILAIQEDDPIIKYIK